MDSEEPPRASQDGRVYWKSGHQELLSKMASASLRTKAPGQRGAALSPARQSGKRKSMVAGLASPSRPLEGDPLQLSASLRASTASRQSKKRRGASIYTENQLLVWQPTASPSSQLKEINQLAAILGGRGSTVDCTASPLRSTASTMQPSTSSALTTKTNIGETQTSSVSGDKQREIRRMSPRKAEKQPERRLHPLPSEVPPTTAKLPANLTKNINFAPRPSSPFARSTSEGSGKLLFSGGTAATTKLLRAPFARVQSVPNGMPMSNGNIDIDDTIVERSLEEIKPDDNEEPDEFGGDSLDALIGAMAEDELDGIVMRASQMPRSSQAKSPDAKLAIQPQIQPQPTINKKQPINAASQRNSTQNQPKPRHASALAAANPCSSSQTLGMSNRLSNTLKKPFKAPIRPTNSRPPVPPTVPKSAFGPVTAPKQPTALHPDVQAAIDDGAFDWAAADGDLSF